MLETYLQNLKNGFKKDGLKLPNLLTEFRLVGSVIPGLMLLFGPKDNEFRIVIVVVFLLIAATDMFDGFTARILNQKTEYGRLLDPVADMFFGFFTLLALSFSNPLAGILLALTIMRQLHLFWLFYKAKDTSSVAVTLSGKAKTAASIIAVVFLLLPKGFLWQGFVISAVTIAGVLTIISWLDYWGKYDSI